MCGFVGWFRSPGTPWREAERARQVKALAQIVHRGPDDGAEASGDGWWMGFRRLSILDLSTHARQPMTFGHGRHTLTFNGEIYNFRELRAQFLGGKGLDSSGDTIVLGTMLERLPLAQVLAGLRGMFAFAWRDESTGAVTLVRDHFGIKPLYYHLGADGALVYGSELRAVAALAGVSEVSPLALAQYFHWGSVQGPETMYAGVRALPPGHLLMWEQGRVEVRAWFRREWPGESAWVKAPAEQQRLVRESVLASVRAHLVADVPVGVFLSGGLDSTLVTACMREAGVERIQAFSIGYEENAGVPDESSAAKRSADFYHCDFTAERLTASSLEQQLDDYFNQMDQPTGDALNTWLVSRVAAKHVKVVLSGLGADEWWAGYKFHRLVALAARSPLLGAGSMAQALQQKLPLKARAHPAWKAAFYLLGGAGQELGQWQAYGRTVMPKAEVARLLREGRGCEALAEVPAVPEAAEGPWLNQLLLRETCTYLAHTLLPDNDMTSMAHSLELRVPLVDVELFKLAGRMPPRSKLSLAGGKRVLREAFQDLLPPWIYHDRKKKGFTLPLMKWMRQAGWRERIQDTLYTEAAQSRAWVDRRETVRTCEEYFKSSLESTAAWSLSQRVWLLYVMEEWARRNVGKTA